MPASPTRLQEASMKKVFVLAALLMATTSAHAGNSISFQIEGHKIRIEAPRNCNSLDCIKVSAPSLSGSSFGGFGSKSKRFDDEDVADSTTPANPAPAPTVQATAPQSAAPVAPAAPSAVATASPGPAVGFDAPTAQAAPVAAPQPTPAAAAPAAPVAAALPLPSLRHLPPPSLPRRPRRSASGPPRRTRAMFASNPAGRTCAATPSRPAKKS